MSFSRVTSYKCHHYVNLKSLIVLFMLSLTYSVVYIKLNRLAPYFPREGEKKPFMEMVVENNASPD